MVSRQQALDCGISPATVRRWARDGRWHALHPGVYLVDGHRLTDEARVRAGGLWAGDTATVTGLAAAYWHGLLPRAPALVEVTLPAHRHPRPQPGLDIRRRALDPSDRIQVRHLWLAGRPLAVLQAAIAVPDGSAFLDRALQRHVRFPAVYRAYCRNLGQPGGAAVARLLIAAADRADSAAERLLVRLLRRAGLRGWVLGYSFGPFLVDLAFPHALVAVEVDGWAWHVDPSRFRADRRKGNALTRAGWELLRYTWHDLDGRPCDVVAEIAEAVSAATSKITTSKITATGNGRTDLSAWHHLR